MLLKDLSNSEYQLMQDSQDLKAVLDYYGIKSIEITGALVLVRDGEYISVWFTEDNEPYSLYADYHQPSYYLYGVKTILFTK